MKAIRAKLGVPETLSSEYSKEGQIKMIYERFRPLAGGGRGAGQDDADAQCAQGPCTGDDVAQLPDDLKELMPREAVLMHGTAEALETMRAKFADQHAVALPARQIRQDVRVAAGDP